MREGKDTLVKRIKNDLKKIVNYMSKVIFLDIECYSNYFLIQFKSDEGKIKKYELFNDNSSLDFPTIKYILENYQTVGFNSKLYDLPMIVYATIGKSNLELKKFSDCIITRGKKEWVYDIFKNYNVYIPKEWNHVDLISIAKGAAFHSLKMYGARLHTKKLQDLPYPPDSIIDEEMRQNLITYCENDLDLTKDFYTKLLPDIELRSKINSKYDLRSLSKAQVAEKLIREELGVISVTNNRIYDKFKYIPPQYLKFETQELRILLDKIMQVEIDLNVDKIDGEDLYTVITLNDVKYKMGAGGLHSQEKKRAIVKSDDEFLVDVDVVSYYPSIIINNNYYPQGIGEKFLDIYKKYYFERIAAKKSGDKIKNETYKIILNGSFGKFGSKWSVLYDPSVLLNTTLTGQFSLFLLIERLNKKGFKVLSANTDGVTVSGNNNQLLLFNSVLSNWQQDTNLVLEQIKYKALYNESVNSYIAIKEDGEVKLKGTFAQDSLDKNPSFNIINRAVIDYVTKDIPITQTIINGNDICEYLSVRTVAGGAMQNDNYLGKVVRWYYTINGTPITYKKNGNKVANSDGSQAIQVLPEELPNDIDYEVYVAKTCKVLKNIGVVP